MKKYIIFLMLLLISMFSVVTAETFGYGRTEDIPINYSLIPTVNNSLYFNGYSISTLYTYYKSLFDTAYDLVYAPITEPLSLHLNGDNSPTADIDWGNQDLYNINNLNVTTQFNSAYDPFNKSYSFNLHTSNATGYDAYEQAGTLAEVTASPSTWGGTQESDFSPLWAVDGSKLTPNNYGQITKYPSILMKFKTGETPTDALYINLTAVSNINDKTYAYFIWDYDSLAWEQMTATLSTPYNVDTYFYGLIEINPENYIDADGTIYMMVRPLTLGGTLQIRLDYIDLQVGVIGGDVAYENRNFNKPISVTTDSTSAYSVFASDGTEVLKVDTIAKAFGGAGLSIDNDAVIGNTLWTKGTASISETTAPTDDILTIQKTYTEDLGNGLYESISWNPTDASTGGFSAMKFRANARGEYNWSEDSTLYGIQGKFFQEIFGAVGNANTTLVASYFIGASESNFADGTSGAGVMANKTYAQILKPLELLAYSGTDMGDAWGLLIQASTAALTNYAIDKETMLEIEKPTLGDVNFQVILQGSGDGTGIWFDSDERLYSDGSDLIYDGGFTGDCVNTSFVGGFAVGCND